MHLGFIFDWDGVVVDSEALHLKSWKLLADSESLAFSPDQFKTSFGMRNERVISELLQWTQDPKQIERLSLKKESHFRALIKKKGISILPGVEPFLQTLHKHKVPCAVGSSTPRLNITSALEILGIEHYFKAIVTAEDVRIGKPNPEVFLLAAHRLNRVASYCVVFEDAPVGIEAGIAAGMTVIGVTTTHPAKALKGAKKIVSRLDELDFEQIEDLVCNDILEWNPAS